MDLALTVTVDAENTTPHDLRIVVGDLVFLDDLRAETAQRLRVRLAFFKGEWFLDLREGVPYFERILVKNPSQATLTAIFSRVVSTTPGVAVLREISVEIDHRARTAAVGFVAVLDDGKILSSADMTPFIVDFQ